MTVPTAIGGRVFVGRERELAELRAGLAEAESGRGRLFLVCGEPGIGKTRLADELAAEARDRGALALWGRCWEGGGSPAYWPWVQIVRSLLRAADPKELRADLGPGAAHVAQIVPELRARLADVPEAAPASADAESENARFYLFDATTVFLKGAAARKPLVLVLEDLHAADSPSLLLLQFLARELSDARIVVVGSYREMEAARAPAVGKALSRIAREGRRLTLGGLTEPEVGGLISQLAERKPAPALISAVHRATEGNPFFVDEVVRLLGSEGRLDERDPVRLRSLRIPESVHDTIRQRLELVPGEVTKVLSVASVIGREFSPSLLEHACGLGDQTLSDVIEDARAAGIVRESSAIRYAFSHALVRETLYQGLLPAERLDLHRRIGEALEWLYGNDPAANVAELAHHFHQAATAQTLGKAYDYAKRAARRSAELLAYEDATVHYEHALELLERRGGGDERERCELLLELGEAQGRTGSAARSRETFVRAGAVARSIPSPEMLARAALGYGGGLEAGGAETFGRVDETLVSLLEEALGALAPEEVVLNARLMARLAVAVLWSAPIERREALCRRAIELAERSGDPGLLASALSAHYYAAWTLDLERRLAAATRVLELAEKASQPWVVLRARRWRLFDFLELGDIAAADAEIDAHARLADELRLPIHRGYTAMFRSVREQIAGRFDDAEKLAEEALVLGERARNQLAVHYYMAQMVAISRALGRFEVVDTLFGAVPDEARARYVLRCAVCRHFAEKGRVDEARDALAALASDDFAQVTRDSTWLESMSFLAVACAVLQDDARAAMLYELLLPYAQRNVVGGGPPTTIWGPVARFLALLATTTKRYDEAERHFEAALKMSSRMGAVPILAHTQQEYADMLLARRAPGDERRARELLDQALRTAESLGMKPLAEKARALKVDRGTETVGETAERPSRNYLHKEGEYWSITYEREAFRLRDTKGLRYLDHLLRHPGREFHALELAPVASDGISDGAVSRSALIDDRLELSDLGDAGEVLDTRARAEYKQRLDDLGRELDEATEHNDLGRAENLRCEIDALESELASAIGLGGRSRKAASVTEKARVNVTKAIQAAIVRIAENSPALGRHLEASIRTGKFFGYLPARRGPRG